MLHWTGHGAVSTPTTLQVRVQQRYPGRVQAGAPVPTRSLSPAELVDNIRWFTEGQRGPRSTPCTGLVLSGVGVASRADLGAALDVARGAGVERVVLHAGVEDLPSLDPATLRGRVERLVLPLRPAHLGLARRLGEAALAAGLGVAFHLLLDDETLACDPRDFAPLVGLSGADLSLSFPFPVAPPGPEATTPARAVAGLHRLLGAWGDAADRVVVKGLPACHLGDASARTRRTGNRWYVDAEHQRGQALLFFPDVVAFARRDACRFCAASERCDGFFDAWLARPDTAPLAPLDA
jgi:hypothetical protein